MVADRYSYLSCLAWAILAGAGLYYFLRKHSADHRRNGRKTFPLAMGGAAVIVIALGVLTWRQVKVWHDSDGLWNHILAIADNSTFRSGNVHHLVARYLVSRGDLDRAIEHFRRSVEIEPNYSPFYNDLGNALARRGRLDEAIENFQQALALNPGLSLAYFNLGSAFALQGRLKEAEQHLEEALRIKPDYPEAYNNLGKVLAAQGQLDKAIDLFRQAIQIQPEFAEAHQSLALALNEKGMKEEAAQELREAMRITQSQSQVTGSVPGQHEQSRR
jgi:tetratricopeptide (TPR) repeat protein